MSALRSQGLSTGKFLLSGLGSLVMVAFAVEVLAVYSRFKTLSVLKGRILRWK